MARSTSYKASVLITGSELLDGRVLDTNSHYIAQQCQQLGLSLRSILTCDDDIDEIRRGLQLAADAVDVVIVSGGLGPTSDDVTRDAIAQLVGQPLYQDEPVLSQLLERYRKRGRSFDPSNVRQALFPVGATILANSVGTAAGFAVEYRPPLRSVLQRPEVLLVSVPGVPRELYAMWPEVVLPLLETHFGDLKAVPCETILTFGLPESVVGSRVSQCTLSDTIKVSYRAAFPEVHVGLSSRSANGVELEGCTHAVIQAIGPEYVISRQLGKGLEQMLHELLIQRAQTLAVAESCSAGLMASTLAEAAGASRFLVGGTIAYANQVKVQALGVPEQLLEIKGAVSPEVAMAMARGARLRHQADFGLSITGIAGPDGGSEEKPVGLFYVGLSNAQGDLALRYFFPNTRSYVRRYAVHCAMDVLRRHLLGIAQQAQPASSQDSQVRDAR